MATTASAACKDANPDPQRIVPDRNTHRLAASPPHRLPDDPRLLQITVLATLLALQITQYDFGATPAQAATTIAAALTTQALFAWTRGIPFDWRSPLITALSLSLLLRTHVPLLWFSAGVLAIASKFLIRHRGKHLFNPAAFAIVALLSTGQTWVSPGIWGTPLWLAFLLASAAMLVLSKAARADTALGFACVYGGLLLARCLRFGDPLTILLHQLQSGTLILFACFMITDPRSTPNHRLGRLLFAAIVATTSFLLQFTWQIREGLFYALIAAAPLTPAIDLWRPAPRFRWTQSKES